MNNLYDVVITAIVVRDGKFLITRRALTKKRWPGKWTVPGGHLDRSDYVNLPKDTENAWYNILERTVKREVKEEVGIKINNIQYVTSIIAEHSDEHSLIISVMADYQSGDVTLQKEETDQFAWVTPQEAKNHELIPGIWEELVLADKKLKGEKAEWQKS